MDKLPSRLCGTLAIASALVLLGSTAFAQSSGSSSSAGASRGGGGSIGRSSSPAGSMAPRVGGGALGGAAARDPTLGNPMINPGAARTTDPRSLSNQPATAVPGGTAPGTISPGGTPLPAGTSTPSGTAYPPGSPLEAARQRALQSPGGTAIPPSAAGVGASRGGIDPATPGLPTDADPNRASSATSGDPARLSGGRRVTREGANGRTMQECEAAWDAQTHMSKESWSATCRRTLTQPRL